MSLTLQKRLLPAQEEVRGLYERKDGQARTQMQIIPAEMLPKNHKEILMERMAW